MLGGGICLESIFWEQPYFETRGPQSVTKLFALTRGLITKNKKLKHNWGSSAGVICSLASVSSVASE